MLDFIKKLICTPFVFAFGLICGIFVMLITPFDYVIQLWEDRL